MAPNQRTTHSHQRIQQRIFTVRETTEPSLNGARVRFEGVSWNALKIHIHLKDSTRWELEALRQSARRIYSGTWVNGVDFELSLHIRSNDPSWVRCVIKSLDPDEPAAGTWTADEDWP